MRTLVFDFSRVVLLPTDKNYTGGLNALYDEHIKEPSYDFHKYFEFNESLLEILEAIKDKYDLHVFTTGHVQNAQEVKERVIGIFKTVHSVENIPFDKKSSEGYLHIASELGKIPSEILYIDDQIGNIKMAASVGFNTILFQNNEQLFRDLKTHSII